MGNHTIGPSALAFIVAVLGLAFVPTQVLAGPLDGYSDAQVMEWLEDELEDLLDDFDGETAYDNGVLEAAVMRMLSDAPPHASAKHLEAHRYLTQAALDAEMREAGTNLRAVVHIAVLKADAMASLQPPRAQVMTAAWQEEPQAGPQLSRPRMLRVQANADGRTVTKNLLTTVPREITAAKSRVRGN